MTLDQAAIGLLRRARRNSLRDDGAARVLADVDHLGAGVGLLHVVGHGDRVELANRVVARRMQLGYFHVMAEPVSTCVQEILRIVAAAVAALGDEIVDAAFAVLVAGIPVLHRRVLDLGVLHGDQFDHRGVQLVFIAHWRRAAFQVADMAAFFGNDQRALELPGIGGIDSEIGRQLHWATHAFGNVDKRPVAEDGGVQRGEEIVAVRHHRAEVFLDQLRVLDDRLGERAEDDAGLGSLSLKVVATETLSKTASTATPASLARSCSGIPSLS